MNGHTYKKLDIFKFHKNILEIHFYNFESTLSHVENKFLIKHHKNERTI